MPQHSPRSVSIASLLDIRRARLDHKIGQMKEEKNTSNLRDRAMPTLAIVHILSPEWTALVTQSPAGDVIFVAFRLLFFQREKSYFKAMQTTPKSQMTSGEKKIFRNFR